MKEAIAKKCATPFHENLHANTGIKPIMALDFKNPPVDHPLSIEINIKNGFLATVLVVHCTVLALALYCTQFILPQQNPPRSLPRQELIQPLHHHPTTTTDTIPLSPLHTTTKPSHHRQPQNDHLIGNSRNSIPSLQPPRLQKAPPPCHHRLRSNHKTPTITNPPLPKILPRNPNNPPPHLPLQQKLPLTRGPRRSQPEPARLAPLERR